MKLSPSSTKAALLCVGGCLLFSLGWLLGGGIALTRGEPDRRAATQTKGLLDEIARLQKQLKNLQGQQTRLADDLREARVRASDVRELKQSVQALKKDLQRVERDRIPNPLAGPASAVRDAADKVKGVLDSVTASPTPSPAPSPDSG